MTKMITGLADDQTRAIEAQRQFNRGANRPISTAAFPMQPAEYHVYLFTVGKRDLKTTHALLNAVEIPACPAGTRYLRFGIPIPEPFPQRVEDVFNVGRDPFDYHRGNAGARRIAQDICDPSNPTLNQNIDDYGKQDPYFNVQSGTNFAKYGVFWSTSLEPEEKEIARAEKKRDTFMRYCINQYDRFMSEDPRQAERLMTAAGFDTKDVRIALEFFNEERPAFKLYKPMDTCPNCSSPVTKGAAFHRDQDGDLCVIDWERTVAAGKKKREDVPPEKRWWKGPGRPKSEESPEESA